MCTRCQSINLGVIIPKNILQCHNFNRILIELILSQFTINILKIIIRSQKILKNIEEIKKKICEDLGEGKMLQSNMEYIQEPRV